MNNVAITKELCYILNTMTLEQVYDYMADIIAFMRREAVDYKELVTINSQYFRHCLKAEQERIDRQILVPPDEFTADMLPNLLALLIHLDKKMAEERERIWWETSLDFCEFKELSALNSGESQMRTNILMLPRYKCMWESESRDKNHSGDINIFLEGSLCVFKDINTLFNKYTVNNLILNPRLYAFCMDKYNDMKLSVGISPISSEINIGVRYIKAEESTNYFCVKPITQYEEYLEETLNKILRELDEQGADICVFPETLGTNCLVRNVKEQIDRNPLRHIKFVVMPSVWEAGENFDDGSNRCEVIGSCGETLFVQDKLARYIVGHKGDDYLEGIREGTEINLIHCRELGSAAVLICRSDLETNIRNLPVNDLNVKLLLVPSWSTGDFEFERTIMAGAERNCNTVWCNTCSAVKDDPGKNVIGIISGYGKNRLYSSNLLSERRFPPDGQCNRQCCNGVCYFIGRIYGSDYTEDDLEGEVDVKDV